MKKREGFTYIEAILGAMLVAILFLGVIKLVGAASSLSVKLEDGDALTDAMINITEALREKITQGTDISDFPVLRQYPGIKGSVHITKEYMTSGIAVFLVEYSMRLRDAALMESVVLNCEE